MLLSICQDIPQNKLKSTIYVISEYVNYIDENNVSKILTLAKISEESHNELVLQYKNNSQGEVLVPKTIFVNHYYASELHVHLKAT